MEAAHLEADRVEARFKSPSLIMARLPEDVRRTLKTCCEVSPAASEDDLVFPRRRVRTGVSRRVPRTEKAILNLWHSFGEKHGLPELRAVDLRHWGKPGLRRLGVSHPAMA